MTDAIPHAITVVPDSEQNVGAAPAQSWAPLTARQITEVIANAASCLHLSDTGQIFTLRSTIDDDGYLVCEVTRWRPRGDDDTVRLLLRTCGTIAVAPQPAPGQPDDADADHEGQGGIDALEASAT